MPQDTTPRTLATKSVAFDRYGSADVLAPRTVELPAPGPGQVRIAVRTAGVNPLDHKLRHGSLSDLFHLALPHVPGIEGAGVVEAVGPDVNELAVGDEVFGCTLTGSYAEYALAEVHRLARRPRRSAGWRPLRFRRPRRRRCGVSPIWVSRRARRCCCTLRRAASVPSPSSSRWRAASA